MTLEFLMLDLWAELEKFGPGSLSKYLSNCIYMNSNLHLWVFPMRILFAEASQKPAWLSEFLFVFVFVPHGFRERNSLETLGLSCPSASFAVSIIQMFFAASLPRAFTPSLQKYVKLLDKKTEKKTIRGGGSTAT